MSGTAENPRRAAWSAPRLVRLGRTVDSRGKPIDDDTEMTASGGVYVYPMAPS